MKETVIKERLLEHLQNIHWDCDQCEEAAEKGTWAYVMEKLQLIQARVLNYMAALASEAIRQREKP